MQPHATAQAFYDLAMVIAEDEALFGDESILEALRRMDRRALTRADIRTIAKICQTDQVLH